MATATAVAPRARRIRRGAITALQDIGCSRSTTLLAGEPGAASTPPWSERMDNSVRKATVGGNHQGNPRAA